MSLKEESYNQLIGMIEGYMGRIPNPPETLNIPEYYSDPEGSMLAKDNIQQDCTGSYALALGVALHPEMEKKLQYAAKSIEILSAWANVNKYFVRENDSALVMVYKAHQFIDAANIIGYRSEEMINWVKTVYLDAVYQTMRANDNKKSWALYGAIMSYHYLKDEEMIKQEAQRLSEHIDNQVVTSYNPFGNYGELWRENLRNNSGMWYTSFSLGAMLGGAWILKKHYDIDLLDKLKLPLDTFFTYCLDPDSWPYRRKWGIFGWLQNLIWPADDEVQIPDKISPGNGYIFASHLYNVPEWREWASSAEPIFCCNIFKFPTLYAEWGLI